MSPTQRPLPDNTQHSQQPNFHARGGIRTHEHSKRAAADPRFRPRAHWARHFNNVNHYQMACRPGHSCQHTTPYVSSYLFLYLFLFSPSPVGGRSTVPIAWPIFRGAPGPNRAVVTMTAKPNVNWVHSFLQIKIGDDFWYFPEPSHQNKTH